MSDVHIFNIKLIHIFYNFFLYAFLGWIYESIYVSVKKKNFVNRGFLSGPIIPLYGLGATLVYIVFWQYREQYLLVFLGGMILATLLEYITSLMMELIFHAKLWEYSDIKYNFQGRICLRASLFWGLLSLIMIVFIQPKAIKLLELIPEKQGIYLSYIIGVVFLTDMTATIVHVLQLNQLLDELQKIKQEFSDYIESTKLYASKEEWKNKFSNIILSDLLENIKGSFEENKEKLIELNKNREGFEIVKFKREIEKQVKEYLCKFHLRISMTSRIQKRLLTAFPNVKFVKREDVLKDLKERLLKHNRK